MGGSRKNRALLRSITFRSSLNPEFTASFWCFDFGFCASRYSGRDRILLFNNDIFFGPSKMPNRYNFRYLTEGRQYREEVGYTVRRGAESIMKVRGKFYYTGDDGRIYETVYEADENGYRPVSRIVGGVKYPYPERFPPPLPDIPLQAVDNDDLRDLTPFGTEYGNRTPNRGKPRTKSRPSVRPTSTTTTTTPFPNDDDGFDDNENQYNEGDNYDYPISNSGGGEKRDTKNQDNPPKESDPNSESSQTDSYAAPPNSDLNSPENDDQDNKESPSTVFEPPTIDKHRDHNSNDFKPPRPKNETRKKPQSVAVEKNDDFLDSLFGN